jgi:hypothetical protein
MQLAQQMIHRSLERVWMQSDSGKGLCCVWVERRISAAAADSQQNRAVDSPRKVA